MSRARQSTASTATPAPRAVGAALPDHEFPSYPLNPAAVHALQKLQDAQSFSTLQRHLNDAGDLVVDNVHSVNECLQGRESYTRKQRAKLEQREEGGDLAAGERATELERQLDEMRARVERMTQKMDESIRKIIDGEHGLTTAQENLGKVSAEQRANTNSSLSQVATQRSSRRGGAATQEQHATQDTDMPDFEPTDPGAAGTASQPAAKSSAAADFAARQQSSRDAYQAHSLYERYADDNRYVGFKRTVHDALNPGEDAPPLPHKSTWFRAGGSPAPGVTGDGDDEAAAEDGDADDDIAVARERISTKCPLTLREFEDVVTSRKCPHSFERSAITGMMRSSGGGRRGGGGEVSVRCPVPGCGQQLTPRDLWTDPVLVRKIRRIQRSRAALREEEDGLLATSSPMRDGRGAFGTQYEGPDPDGSDSGEDIDAVERRTQRRSTVPKQERVVPPKRAANSRTPRSSTAVGVGGDEDDDTE